MPRRRTFGHIPGIRPGTPVSDRRELAASGVHPPLVAGISGAQRSGADSIGLNGGYEDDEDYGELVIYTGEGGRGSTGRQIRDQELSRGNRALVTSRDLDLPVRVSRGPRAGRYAPASGYRYDGLYRIDRYWPTVGRSGHRIWRFRLVATRPSADVVDEGASADAGADSPGQRKRQSLTPVRDEAVAAWVKDAYSDSCQVCGAVLETPAGRHAQAAHIRPLGRPHDGPDRIPNVLCLCPNHHACWTAEALRSTQG